MTKFVCPECEKDDMVQKVSAIYSGGISTMIYGNVDNTAVSKTGLAKRLAPPTKPEGNVLGCGGLMILLFLATGLPFGMVGMLMDWGVRNPIIFVIFSGVGLYFYFLIFKHQNKQIKNRDKILIPAHESQVNNWNKLFYCFRNDCVFDPETRKSASPERISELLK
jgi:hypothetical protein